MDRIDVDMEDAFASVDRRIEADRTPPHSDEAEISVLGGMMLEEGAVDRAMELLGEDDFYHPAHRLIFGAIGRLRDQGHSPDALAVREELKRRDELEGAGGPEYLARIVDIVPTAANVGYHAKIVLDAAIKRRLIRTGTEIVTGAYGTAEDADYLLNQAEERIFKLSEHRFKKAFTPINELLQRAVVELESLAARKEPITGVPTGYHDLDDITAGLQLADLVIVAARPSVGKCLAADSEIVLSDGSLKTIEDIVRERDAELLTLGDDWRFGWAKPSDFVDDGVKPTYRVRTETGRVVETTLSHPFLTGEGWRPLTSLAVGESVAVPRTIPVEGTEKLTDYEIEQFVRRTTRRPEGRFDADAFGPTRDSSECHPQWDVESSRRRTSEAAAVAGEPAIPETIFRCEPRTVARFLRRLFSERSAMIPGWSAGGERAAHQVQHLLSRFGVVAHAVNDAVAGWRVEIQDPVSVRRFDERIAGGSADDQSVADESHVYWDEIVSIEYVGEKQVYDLTIPDTHNFVANDVCVHNTSLATCFAANAAIMNDLPVAIFSLEMSTEQLVQRLISMEAMVSLKELRTGHASGEQWKRVADACDRLRRAAIYIDDTGLLTPMEMRAKARRLKQQRDIGMVIVDYLQLMETGTRSESRQQEITEISRSLKALAKELNIPVVALSQLSRAPEQRTDQRPRLSDLRECVTGDTLVVLADGSRTPIRELVGEEPEVLAIDERSRVVRALADKVWSAGVREVFDVRLASGRRIRATGRHRFMTGSGWLRLEDIEIGHRIALARVLPEPAEPIEWPDDRVALLGQLIGDGSYLVGQPMRYTTGSEANSELVAQACQGEFGAEIKRYEGPGNWHQLLISGNGNRWHPAGVNAWLREIGIFGQRSDEKRLPRSSFRLSDRQVALLLRHLWATDGTVWPRRSGRGSHAVYFSTASEGLAADVAAILLRVGVVARIRRVDQASGNPVFNVAVSGTNQQLRFLNRVGAFGPRVVPAEELRELLLKTAPNPNVDTLPREFLGRVRKVMQAQGLTQRAVAAARGSTYIGHFTHVPKRAPSRATLSEYAEILDDDELRDQASSDLFWDRVVEIRPDGEEEVYDLTVPGPANWLADGIVSHNSGAIEQDADLVLFLYRDKPKEDEVQETRSIGSVTEIIVGKNRNGPTGTIELVFLEPYMRFEDLDRHRSMT